MRTKISDADPLTQLEAIDPATATMRDRSATADIRAAVRMQQNARELVDQAVKEARSRGVSWIEIGLALGISPQGARQRYM